MASMLGGNRKYWELWRPRVFIMHLKRTVTTDPRWLMPVGSWGQCQVFQENPDISVFKLNLPFLKVQVFYILCRPKRKWRRWGMYSHTFWECAYTGSTSMEGSLEIPVKIKVHILSASDIPVLSIYPAEILSHLWITYMPTNVKLIK